MFKMSSFLFRLLTLLVIIRAAIMLFNDVCVQKNVFSVCSVVFIVHMCFTFFAA